MKNRNTQRGGEAEWIQQGQMAFHGKGPGSCNDPAGDIEAGHGALRGASHLLCGREEPAGLAFSEFRGYEGWQVVATGRSPALKLVAVIRRRVTRNAGSRVTRW